MTARSVVITGCSTGIGRACALRMLGAGWTVFAGVRNDEDGHSLERDAGQGDLVPVHLDVTKRQEIEECAALVRGAVGEDGLGGLVNNAGVGMSGPIEAIELDELRWHFEVNLFGVVAVTQAFTELLRLVPGRIINISSMAATVSGPYWGAYTASKKALEGITDSFRQELDQWGIYVSSVQPSATGTATWRKAASALEEKRSKMPERMLELYSKAIDCRLTMDAKLRELSGPPEVVARVVERALTAHRPKTRYAVGKGAMAATIARRLMSDRSLDAIMLKQLGLRQK